MSDDQKAKPFATSGSGKSPEEVAFDLVNKLKGQGVWGERNISAILDMYAECLDATKGLRAYEGQKRIETPIMKAAKAQAPAPTPQVQQAPVQRNPAQAQIPPHAPAQPAQRQHAPLHQPLQVYNPAQSAPVQPVQAQPVQAQHAQLQQAFKQG